MTTQFSQEGVLDIGGTQETIDALVRDGVHGLVLLGTCGENNSLLPAEKRLVLQAAVEVVGGRIPTIAGISELTTERAAEFARDAEAIGVDGLMALPAMVYVPTEEELEFHFRTVARASDLPVMLYNNPPAYRVAITLDVLRRLTDAPNIVAVKESSPDTRRFTDIINAFSDRYVLMAGLDDVALEGLLLGAAGWISGLTSAFPRESVSLVEAVDRGDLQEALKIYRWFMPLLHLDSGHDLVQSIKLAESIMGRGSEWVRLPRRPLSGARRAEVIAMVETAAATRPLGPKAAA